jgi:Tol biopolymer transport system component
MRRNISIILSIILLTFLTNSLFAQYFGQNKVNYEKFDFKIYKTPHFWIYNYLENNEAIQGIGEQSEYWYNRHFSIFRDTIKENPIIFYNNHADFKQTTVISGLIGVGTGGVTEGLRQRVVMPFMVSNRETDHVLGHEMIHVFQYNMVLKADSLGFESLNNLPLWMVEGLAEYMSIGPNDNKTAMWMRDAVINDDVPSIEDMSKNPNEYFPYRYGHAFWSFITGIWGDAMIKPIFYNTAKYGLENAVDSLFGVTLDSLSNLWIRSVKRTNRPYIHDTIDPVGQKLFTPENSGELNLSPVLSPDGEKVTFLTNKNVISIDLMVANTETKEIIKKLTSSVRQAHIDDFNYIESAGSWSPDGSKYVLTSFSKGRNKFIISNVEEDRVKVEKEFFIDGVAAFNNPEWSPDGESILFTGLDDGQSDLYLYHLESEKLEKLTDDRYSDMQASFSSDGERIVFISERGRDTQLEKNIYGKYRLCIMDRSSGEIDVLDVFPDKDNFSPNFSPDDQSVIFLSHADGYRNLYEYDLNTDKVYRLTNLVTGISGITDLSPAYSISQETGKIAYTIYADDNYHIYSTNLKDLKKEEVNKNLAISGPEKLPPGRGRVLNIVENNLERYPTTPDTSFASKPYKPKFQLDYLGSSGVGVGTGQFGTYASGGVSALFSDVLKRHQIFVNLQVQGEIYDFGGYAFYMNQESRLHWGGAISHIPYRFSQFLFKYDSTDLNNDGTNEYVRNIVELRQRYFEDQLSVFAEYPLSQKLRFEGGLNISRYSFRIDSINNYYSNFGFIYQDREKVDGPEPYYVGRGYLAFVGESANYGITGPLRGYRYRFQGSRMFAEYNIYNTLVDFQRFFFMKPFSFAFRSLHFARYGEDVNRVYSLYAGNQYYIRGYSYGALDSRNTATGERDYNLLNNLLGSKMGILNAEIRLPFSGVKRLTLIQSKYFYTTLVGFFDAGFAVENWNQLRFSWDPIDNKRIPVYSAGLGVRINLFGYAILEPYVAMPFQLESRDFNFGIIIRGQTW